MKKSLENYSNIKLTKTNLKDDDQTTATSSITTNTSKRLIFKTKPSTKSQTQILTETKLTTNEPSTKLTKAKIVLKRSINENNTEKYNLRNSFDESDEDEFNVFDLNKKTSQLTIKKCKTDSSPLSSSSASSFSSSFTTNNNTEISPKTNLKPVIENKSSPTTRSQTKTNIMPKKFELPKLTDSEDETKNKTIKINVHKTEQKSEPITKTNENEFIDNKSIKNIAQGESKVKKIKLNINKETDSKLMDRDVKKLNQIKEIKEEKNEESKLKKTEFLMNKFNNLIDEDDLDIDDSSNVKKFKLIKRTTNIETKTEKEFTKLSNIKPSVIQHKIFSSKKNSNDSSDTKLTKFSSFKLNFNNDNEQDTDEYTDKDENSSNDSSSFKSIQKSSSLTSTVNNKQKFIISNKSNSLNSKINPVKNDPDTTLMIINLRNTRKAYECEELGEAQAFLDDFAYLMDGLNSKYKLSERCLSAIKLAESCLSAEFRMNLRSSNLGDDYYINKIFSLLSDCVKFKSLSLCTSLIIFALTQDKLIIDIDNSTFNLIISILNMNEKICSSQEIDELDMLSKYSYLNDLNNSKLVYSCSSSLANSPTTSQNSNNNNNNNEFECIDDNNDEFVYKKIFTKCKKLFDNLIDTSHDQININLNSQLISIDCLLNLNQNMKKNLLTNDYYKNELRLMKVIDKLLIRIKFLIINLKTNDNYYSSYLLTKLKSCLNLLETLTQSTSLNGPNRTNQSKNIKSIKYIEDSAQNSDKLPIYIINQNYLIDFRQHFLIDLVKDSLNFFHNELQNMVKKSPKLTSDQTKSNLLTCALKEFFLLLINLTHNNEYTSKKLSSDLDFLDMIFKFLQNDETNQYILVNLINENEHFDLLIMLLGVLLNLLVNCFKQKTSNNILKYKNKLTNLTAIEIILNLYKTKEALVRVAENDQENEFNQLNEQIESQNIDNINLAIMNSIHKAGKHMEDHIIAAHSALIIGYMLLDDEYLNDENFINANSIKLKIKDNSFKYMIQIIRKFIVFMNIMKVTGFSAEEHIEVILNYLEKLND